MAGNVYSFALDDGQNVKAQSQATQYESELAKKENEIALLQQELDAKEVATSVETEEANQVAPKPKTEINGVINTAQRFIEYAFENDPDTYITRKKMALNYMTESLYETLYSSDGVAEEQQKIAVEINEVAVFAEGENVNEAIVYYVYNEEILSSGYEEEKEMYIKLLFTVEGDQIKVAEVEPLKNEYGGI